MDVRILIRRKSKDFMKNFIAACLIFTLLALGALIYLLLCPGIVVWLKLRPRPASWNQASYDFNATGEAPKSPSLEIRQT